MRKNRVRGGLVDRSEPGSPAGALVAGGCDRIFQEKASGKSIKNRPELERAVSALGTGDVLVLAEWDRCIRSMIDGVAIIERINPRVL